jgi:hypothetical protein
MRAPSPYTPRMIASVAGVLLLSSAFVWSQEPILYDAPGPGYRKAQATPTANSQVGFRFLHLPIEQKDHNSSEVPFTLNSKSPIRLDLNLDSSVIKFEK